MKTMLVKRSTTIVLLVATTFAVLTGCTAARKTSTPTSSVAEAEPVKEYQWKDMSQGKSFFEKAKPTPQN